MPEGCPEELALGSKDLAMLQYPFKPDEAAHVRHPWRSQERGSLGLPGHAVLLDVLWIQ